MYVFQQTLIIGLSILSWTDFDHETGIPIKFEDEEPECGSGDNKVKEEVTESSSEEMSIDKSDEDSASAQESSSSVSASAQESSSSDSASAQESSSGVEMLSSGLEEPILVSSSGENHVSSSEMSADSLENIKGTHETFTLFV